MTTLLLILIALLLAVAVYLLAKIVRGQKGALTALRNGENATAEEKQRLFRFLRELGEAICREDQQQAMHRLIVEGAMRVTQSTGGAIYLLDAPTRRLVPKFFSEHCAAPVELPQRVLDQPASQLSFLRMHATAQDEGAMGRVFTQQKSELIRDLGHGSAATALISPLSFGGRKLGVLILTAPIAERAYSTEDRDIFTTIAGQSAVALANSVTQQESAKLRADRQELHNARDIQKILLPARDPQVPGYVIAGKNIPARQLSGDYFDFIPLPEGRFGAVIADVSGKGMPGALVTVMCRTLLRAAALANASPAAALAGVNRAIAPDMHEGMFITMTYLVLAKDSPQVHLARAGHTAALLWRSESGKIELIEPGGLGVGIDTGSVFERVTKDTSFEMKKGDCLLLYTDGVNEAMNAQEDEFGEERIYSSLTRLAPSGPRAIIDGLISDLDGFLSGKRSHDDITLIALQRTV
ncbi:MAG: SpoIIE family protein phosphatase [Verrucomicrobiaceae bacterium]|nr:SpoIIE family protein phosphatase [Verrucomicrobiaceae bacterium]